MVVRSIYLCLNRMLLKVVRIKTNPRLIRLYWLLPLANPRGFIEMLQLRKVPLTMIVMMILLLNPLTTWVQFAAAQTEPTLDPLTIPKYVTPLPIPPVWEPTIVTDSTGKVVSHNYTISASQFTQQILPAGFPPTTVWGYSGLSMDPLTGESLGVFQHTSASSFEAIRGIPISVKWVNNITGSSLFPVDPTLHWADPNNITMNSPFEPYPPGYPQAQSPVPIVAHLHGGEDPSTSDGVPEQWWTSTGLHGADYTTEAQTDPNAAIYHYPNLQQAATLWYHDHALGLTRINVLAGLAGFYFIRDPADPVAPLLPSGKYEVPLVLQDRSFNVDGSIWFPNEGANPYLHPYWASEYIGNTNMVNGAVWPKLDVDSGQYRFRVLDAANARFYNLFFSNRMEFTVIGSDGGYLKQAVKVTNLLMGPGERYDILVDFSSLPTGTEVLLRTDAVAPYPDGPKTDPETEGQIMKFSVTSTKGFSAKQLPDYLNPLLPADKPFPTLIPDAPVRILTLDELAGAYGPSIGLLDGQRWAGAVSELPVEGTTEDWALINLTEDAHDIHLHLVQFQLVGRQSIDWKSYEAKWVEVNGEPLPFTKPTIPVDYIPYLQEAMPSPKPLEQGWKDTIIVWPHTVTIIRVRFSPVDGRANYSFNVTAEPGYVWHCHILDHEDNEMMRPYKVVAAVPKQTTTITCTPSASDILKRAPVKVSGAITPTVAGAVVTLTYTGGALNVTRSATTGSDGKFNDTYTPNIAASWSVRASWIGNNVFAGSVSQPAQFTVMEPPSWGSIKITIRDSSGNLVQGAAVSSTSTPGGQATLTGDTGSDGVITFNDVSPGSYTVRASKSGYTTQIVTVAVMAGETQDTSVTLQAESTGIPGYPLESVLVGFLVVVGAILLLARRRSRGVGSIVHYSRSSFSKHN